MHVGQALPASYFLIKGGHLYFLKEHRGQMLNLLVVSHSKVGTIMHLTHSHPLGGHLRACSTLERIRDKLHWPGMEAEVINFCQ